MTYSLVCLIQVAQAKVVSFYEIEVVTDLIQQMLALPCGLKYKRRHTIQNSANCEQINKLMARKSNTKERKTILCHWHLRTILISMLLFSKCYDKHRFIYSIPKYQLLLLLLLLLLIYVQMFWTPCKHGKPGKGKRDDLAVVYFWSQGHF